MGKRKWSGLTSRGVVSIGALVALTLAGGCSVNSQMTDLWHDTTVRPGSIHNLFVVSLRKDPVRRRVWEDAFAKGLAARGVTATSSYRVFPEAPPDTQQVIEIVRKNGYDAVLTSIRLADEATSTFVPGALAQRQVTSEDYFGRLHSYWATVQDPGYTETDNVVLVQTDVWAITTAGGHLVSSATLRTLESAVGRSVESAVTRHILPELEKQGVVPRRLK